MESVEVTQNLHTEKSSWDYNFFREYLLAIGRNHLSNQEQNYILSANEYPNKIELSSEWHQLLNQMRDKTVQNKRELFGVVGFRSKTSSILLQSFPVEGNSWEIPRDVVENQYRKAKDNDIDVILGDIHSHPRRPISLQGREMPYASTSDLQFFIEQPCAMMGIVNENGNLFIFKSRQTHERKPTKSLVKVLERARETLGIDPFVVWALKKPRPLFNKYHLVGYTGRHNEELTRLLI